MRFFFLGPVIFQSVAFAALIFTRLFSQSCFFGLNYYSCKRKKTKKIEIKMPPKTSSGSYTGTGDKADLDNHSNQLNPNHAKTKTNANGK
jgi:hypothetical protein